MVSEGRRYDLPSQCAVQVFNHLLRAESWARAALLPHAGRAFSLRMREWKLNFGVTADGVLEARDHDDFDAVIVMPDAAPWLWWRDRAAFFGQMRLSGSAEFCEALAHVFRNLRWDREADLARIVGDIAAHRIENGLVRAQDTGADIASRLVDGLAEALNERASPVVQRGRLDDWRTSLDLFRTDLARLEERVGRLA